MLESVGTIRIYQKGSSSRQLGNKAKKQINKGGTIQIDCDWGIVLLYTKFIQDTLDIKINSPRQGAHITIIDEKFNKNVNFKDAMKWNNKKVSFSYNPEIIEGGRFGEFRNFYMMVECEEINKIKKELGVIDSPRFLGHHLTIGNTKGL